ncbi:MAG: alpha-amylase family glycosyl hydrolase [Opitutales bacterium]|jgi:1,4-alpha-glucan branching enzyme
MSKKTLPSTLIIALLAVCAGLFPAHSATETPAELLRKEPSSSLPEWVRNQTIYEINVRQYSEEGTFAVVEADLDRIESLGVRTLWLMPIHPIGVLNRKGELGSYYAIQNYLEVNPEFGTKEEFKSFVDAAHARGMRIILDWGGQPHRLASSIGLG